MIAFYLRALIFICLTVLSTTTANAAAPAWQIVPNASSITFTATQNNAPVTGKFRTFTGEINFDPAQLGASNIRIVVDMGSVVTSYSDVADTLKTADWFAVKLFPQAVFTANHFTKINNNTYQATGTLTLRDKTLPTNLTFVLDEFTATKAHAKGTTTLKRTAFGIGKGEWSKTDEVKDDVQVNFTLTALKK
jgi:polyisoprenoid-binding protein YceI